MIETADSNEVVRELCSYGDVKLVRKGSKYFVIRGTREIEVDTEGKTREELMWELRDKLSDLGLLGRQLGECTFMFLNALVKDLGLEEIKGEASKEEEEVKETKGTTQPKEVVVEQPQKETPQQKESVESIQTHDEVSLEEELDILANGRVIYNKHGCVVVEWNGLYYISYGGRGKLFEMPPKADPDTIRAILKPIIVDSLNVEKEKRILIVTELVDVFTEEMRRKQPEEKVERSVEVSKRRELSDDQVKEIVEVLKPYYKDRYQDYLVLKLAKALDKAKVSYESTRKVVEKLAEASMDKDKERRLKLVDYCFGGDADIDASILEGVKEFASLRDVIERQLKEGGMTEDEASDNSLMVMNKLNEILETFLEINVLLVPLKTGKGLNQYYANDPKRGILIVTRKGDDVTREYVFGFYIEKVVIHVNPNDPKDVVYSIVFRHPKTGDRWSFNENFLGNIVRDIEESKHGVRNINKLKSAISSLIEGFRVKGLAEIRKKIPATGFFEVDGKLMLFESSRFKINLPVLDRDKTIEALKCLDDLLSFWKHSDKVVGNLYDDVQSPLGYFRKLYGRENKIVFPYGEPHVGKTLRAKIYAYMWGLDEGKVIVGASNITPAQLAERLNETTFKIVLDDARNVFQSLNLVDMLKNATTNLHVKSRIIPQQGYRVAEFYAYASLEINTNYVQIDYPGVEERLIPFKWTADDKRDPKTVEEFLQKLPKYKEILPYIGSYLADMFKRRWAEIKKIIVENDNIEAGRKILEMMYEELGIEKPAWLKPVKLSYEIEIPQPEEIFFNVIREDLQDAVRKANLIVRVDESGREEAIKLTDEDWLIRLDMLGKSTFLPSYMKIGKKNVYIDTSVIREIKKKKGIEIAGGLENLAKRLGFSYQPYNGVKCMVIPLEEFVKRLTQVVEEENQP